MFIQYLGKSTFSKKCQANRCAAKNGGITVFFFQGSKEIRQLMYIPNDDSDTQNYPLCTLKLVVETFWHSIKWFNKRLLSQRIRKYFKTLGTTVTNSPKSTPSLFFFCGIESQGGDRYEPRLCQNAPLKIKIHYHAHLDLTVKDRAIKG